MSATELEMARYNEALLKPKLDKSLEYLINKYEAIMPAHHVQNMSDLLSLIEKAVSEGNDILILREYCGYMVLVWKA